LQNLVDMVRPFSTSGKVLVMAHMERCAREAFCPFRWHDWRRPAFAGLECVLEHDMVPLVSFRENAGAGRTFPQPASATATLTFAPSPEQVRAAVVSILSDCRLPCSPPPVARQLVKRSDTRPGACCPDLEWAGLVLPTPQARHPPPDGGPFCAGSPDRSVSQPPLFGLDSTND
jgi:hypothetical protein